MPVPAPSIVNTPALRAAVPASVGVPMSLVSQGDGSVCDIAAVLNDEASNAVNSDARNALAETYFDN